MSKHFGMANTKKKQYLQLNCCGVGDPCTWLQ